MRVTPLSAWTRLISTVIAAASVAIASGAERAQVRVSNPDASVARPGEVIVIPFAEIRKHIPDAHMYHLDVRDTDGARVAAQATNFNPDDRRALYDDLVFQHDFAAGEEVAVFSIQTTDTPVPPAPMLVSARHIPERLDDFAWENDRVGHRIYGPALMTAAAGGSRMISSGIDVWCKRVRYPIVDRWYTKGHDAYHVDTGEGLDLYSVGTTRGCGGTGVWEGDRLWVSRNWENQRVLANGPIRAIFEIGYETWQAGPRWIMETKRFTVDAGRNLDQIESTFTVQKDGDVVIAIGIGKPSDARVDKITRDERSGILSVWQTYEKTGVSVGCGIVLSPDADFVGFVDDAQNYLILARARSGVLLRYHAGSGWTGGGDFPDVASWENYLQGFAARLRAPVRVTLSAMP